MVNSAIMAGTDGEVCYEGGMVRMTEAELKNELAYGNIVIATLHHYGTNQGHDIVIYGYVNYDGLYFLVRDPSPVNIGKDYTIRYSDLVNLKGYTNQTTRRY